VQPDVSVVVPVFNPGPNLDYCVGSVLGQTLDPRRHELILVDDGSTDGSAPRVDQIAAAHPDRIRATHIPSSGWASRPRNVGIEMARGRYVQLLDNDDTLAPDALRRELEVADSSDADIVIGRFASNFRGLNHWLFRETVTGRTLADFPMEYSLTPHKLFRREFLDQNALRFVEDIRNLEDQIFCMQAYVKARSVALVADTLCYHYEQRRGPGRNAGTRRLDAAAYYAALERVFDVIDSGVEDPTLRLRLYLRFYRDEMLRRLREDNLLRYPVPYRDRMQATILDLARRRIPAELHPTLPALLRTQSRLFLDDDIEGMVEYSKQLVALTLDARCEDPVWEQGRLSVRAHGRLMLRDQPFRLEQHDGGWALPEAIAPSVRLEDRRLLDLNDEGYTELSLVARSDGASWSAGADIAVTIDADGSVRVDAIAEIDPDRVVGGGRLGPGLWDLKLRVQFAGLTRTAMLGIDRPADSPPGEPSAWLTSQGSVEPYWTNKTVRLSLDVDQWMHPLAAKVGRPLHARGGRGRSLLLDAPRLQGPQGHVVPAECILTAAGKNPADGRRRAKVSVSPSGGVVEVEPAHGRHGAHPDRNGNLPGWTTWLRIGAPGTGPMIEVDPSNEATAAGSGPPA